MVSKTHVGDQARQPTTSEYFFPIFSSPAKCIYIKLHTEELGTLSESRTVTFLLLQAMAIALVATRIYNKENTGDVAGLRRDSGKRKQ